MRVFHGLLPTVCICALSAAAAGQAGGPVVALPSPDAYYQPATGGEGHVELTESSRNVEVVVNAQLHASGEIAAGLATYLADIRLQGYTPILTTTGFADAAALRAHLAARRAAEGLAGAVLIGDLPAAYYEIAEHTDAFGYDWEYESFPSDLYFQDLDGAWTDADADGSHDGHAGNVAPEIWLGRLVTHQQVSLHPGRTEAGLLNDYFARNHAYRFGRLGVPEDALAYIDDDWAGYWGSRWAADLAAAVGGAVTRIDQAATTTAWDYKQRLQAGWEHVLLCAHSNVVLHRFKIGDDWAGGDVLNADLAPADPNVLFYNLYACSSGRLDREGFLAGEYVFGTNMGLLAVTSAKTGSMLEFDDYFDPLGDGRTFGGAWLSWWAQRAVGGFSAGEKDWHYGMTLLGDPLLVTQAYLPIPEPAALSLLSLGLAAVVRRRRPRRGAMTFAVFTKQSRRRLCL